MRYLHEGPVVYGPITKKIERRKKAQHPTGFKPMISKLQCVSSTTVLQPQPKEVLKELSDSLLGLLPLMTQKAAGKFYQC